MGHLLMPEVDSQWLCFFPLSIAFCVAIQFCPPAPRIGSVFTLLTHLHTLLSVEVELSWLPLLGLMSAHHSSRRHNYPKVWTHCKCCALGVSLEPIYKMAELFISGHHRNTVGASAPSSYILGCFHNLLGYFPSSVFTLVLERKRCSGCSCALLM